MKIYLKALGYTGIVVLGLTLILTFLHYVSWIGEGTVNVVKLVIAIVAVATGGYIVGNSCSRKGWLEGLKLAGMLLVILALLTLIFRLGFTIETLTYYAIVTASSVIGSMFGISIKEKRK